jgi:5-formyltetrahydrofolate cyclo-ligase
MHAKVTVIMTTLALYLAVAVSPGVVVSRCGYRLASGSG